MVGGKKYPQQDSNLRHRLRRPVLYPLSYGGEPRKDYTMTRPTGKMKEIIPAIVTPWLRPWNSEGPGLGTASPA